MVVEDLIARAPVAVPGETPVGGAARRMKARDVGTVLVVDETGDIAGIVTDRDIVLALLGGLRVWEEPVAEIMTPWPVTIEVGTDVETCVDTMLTYGVRRVPVVDAAGEVVGVVSLDDILIHVAGTLSALAGLVRGAVLGAET